MCEVRPRLLDLFCGAGGCSKGYADAGFFCIGVDIAPQKRYCGDEFYQEDALIVLDLLLTGGAWHGYRLQDFAVIHASPPCQGYSRSRGIAGIYGAKEYPLLIDEVRRRLEISGIIWIIENVEGSDLPDAIELCGSMFGLAVRRHRWFSSCTLLFAPGPCQHLDYCINPVGNRIRGYGALASNILYKDAKGTMRKREGYLTIKDGQIAMGIDWMSTRELCQAIPPAYTRWIGFQLRDVLASQEAVS